MHSSNRPSETAAGGTAGEAAPAPDETPAADDPPTPAAAGTQGELDLTTGRDASRSP
jgi:hypothetical protein